MTTHRASNSRLTFSLVALFAVLSGCSSYRILSERVDTDPVSSVSGMADVVVGRPVRVTRFGGERVTGVVLEIADGTMTIQRFASHGKATVVVPLREIGKIELRQSEPMPTLGKIAIAGISMWVGYYLLFGLAFWGSGGLD